MKTFKLRKGVQKIYPISKDIFEDKTEMRKPYYDPMRMYDVQYAVCPQCDNPIEIIGLYKKLKNTDNPYGRHYPQNIRGLAEYNQQAYNFCPYASHQKNKVTADTRKEELTEYEKNIYCIMRENFDIAVEVISQELDIKVSASFAERMLSAYVVGKGWLYPYSTPNNIPWMLWYLSWSKPLYKQQIRYGSELYNRILEKCPNVEFLPAYDKNYRILSNKDGAFLDLRTHMTPHNHLVQDDSLRETIDFIVGMVEPDQKLRRIFVKKLEINQTLFANAIAQSKNKKRNEKLLSMAKEYMPEL